MDDVLTVICKICAKIIPLCDVKAHLLDTCIPSLLFRYGCGGTLPTSQEFEKLTQSDKEHQILKVKHATLQEKYKQRKATTIVTTSQPPPPVFRYDSPTNSIFSSPPPTPSNSSIAMDNSFMEETFHVKKEFLKQADIHTYNNSSNLINLDIPDGDQGVCTLGNQFKVQQKDVIFCTNSVRGSNRIEITCFDKQITLCKPAHITDEYCQTHLVRPLLARPISLDDVKESISNRPKEELVKCASCPNKCTMSIRCKASSLTPIKDNYLYFCTYSCFQKYFGSSSGKTWSAYIESKQPKKDKKEKKETNKEKGKDDDSDEESSHEEDEEGYVVEDEEQHTDKKRKASTPPKPTTKKAPAKKAAAKDKDKSKSSGKK